MRSSCKESDSKPLAVEAAAIESPIVVAEASADDSSRLVVGRAAQGDVGLSSTEIAQPRRRVELDVDFRMELVQFAEQRCNERGRENLLHADFHRSAKIPRIRGGGIGKAGGGTFTCSARPSKSSPVGVSA